MTISFPNIDPVAFEVPIVGLPIRWYSLGYIFGIGLGWWYLTKLIRNTALWGEKGSPPISRLQLDDVVFWVALGIIAGGRFGYVIFYEPSLFIQPWASLGASWDPGLAKSIIGWLPFPPFLMTWNGGMSFHGGLIGVTLAGLLFAHRYKINAFSLGDLFACAAPIAVFLVRIANFVNAELYGRPWDGPWAMIFPTDSLQVTRHPSQLYEAAFEGVLLFLIIRIATHSFGLLKKPGAIIGIFLSGYAVSRILIENFREPDAHLPNFPFGLTMGMMLSGPMLATGLWLILRAHRKNITDKPSTK